jgi:hypothetical protein
VISNHDIPADPGLYPPKRWRRRRRDFLEALQQSQADSYIPLVEVGWRLRELRTESGLTIRDLAKKAALILTLSA